MSSTAHFYTVKKDFLRILSEGKTKKKQIEYKKKKNHYFTIFSYAFLWIFFSFVDLFRNFKFYLILFGYSNSNLS